MGRTVELRCGTRKRRVAVFFWVFTTLRLFGARVVSMCEPDCKPSSLQLIGGLEHKFYFSIIYGMSSFPLTTHIFQDGYCTTNQTRSGVGFHPQLEVYASVPGIGMVNVISNARSVLSNFAMDFHGFSRMVVLLIP